MATLIRKIKRSKLSQNEEKREGRGAEKENHATLQSSSSSKLIKPKEALKRQFASTANLHLNKKPLSEYISNK